QIRSAELLSARIAPARRAEDVTEHIAENIAECIAASEPGTATASCGCFDTRVSILIVCRPLLGVGEHLARLLGLLEAILRILVIRIGVGVVFHRQTGIGLLDLWFGRRFGYVEYLVVIAFGHELIKPAPYKTPSILPALPPPIPNGVHFSVNPVGLRLYEAF